MEVKLVLGMIALVLVVVALVMVGLLDSDSSPMAKGTAKVDIICKSSNNVNIREICGIIDTPFYCIFNSKGEMDCVRY